MISAHPAVPGKAGKSGLFHCLLGVLALIAMAPAGAEPVAVEVVEATVSYDGRTSEPLVSFRMSAASARVFAELTAKNVGRKLAIRVDGRVMSAPVVREPIIGGSGQISANLTMPQATDIAARLSSGQARLEFDVVD